MPELRITLSSKEMEGLTDLARDERRTPGNQAAYIVAAVVSGYLEEKRRNPVIVYDYDSGLTRQNIEETMNPQEVAGIVEELINSGHPIPEDPFRTTSDFHAPEYRSQDSPSNTMQTENLKAEWRPTGRIYRSEYPLMTDDDQAPDSRKR